MTDETLQERFAAAKSAREEVVKRVEVAKKNCRAANRKMWVEAKAALDAVEEEYREALAEVWQRGLLHPP